MGSARGHAARGSRRRSAVVAALVVAAAAASCSVDASGVIRASEDSAPVDLGTGEETSTDECGDLLTRLQTAAVDLVGPEGFIGSASAGIDGPFFGGRFIGDFGVVGPGGSSVTGVSVGEPVVTVGDLLAMVEGGRLYLFDADGGAQGTVWLDALPERRWPAVDTGLLTREGELVAVSPAVSLRDDAGDPYSATVIQRIDIDDPTDPVVIERLTVRGEVAGANADGDGVRVAVAVPPPALDFLFATTAGGEEAATEHNRGLLSTTTLADWLGGYELTVPDADGGAEVTRGLLGGCDVVAAEGAESALGATALIDLGPDGELADLAATTVLGEGRVSFGDEAIYVLSPRTHAIGFTDPGRQGSPRVIVSRVVAGDEGLVVDGRGIVAGSLSPLPTPAISDDHVMIFTSTLDQFGNGGYEATSLGNIDGEIREVDKVSLPVEPWDTLTLRTIGDDILLSGQQGSALVDASDPEDLDVVGVAARWESGNFVGPPQLVPYGEGRVLSVDPGRVAQDFGGIDNFFQQIQFGEFGFGWEPWNEPGNESTASIRIVEGHPLSGEEVASFDVRAFALWPVAADETSGDIVAGAIGLADEDGTLFDGAILLRHEGDRLVEVQRWPVDAPDVEDFGATECEKVDIQGNLLDILGLWNQTPLRCDPGDPGGMVGHTCTALTIPEISEQELMNWFGFENTEAIEEMDEMRAAVANGSAFQACVPRQAGVPSVVRGYFADEGESSGWLVGAASVHRVGAGGEIMSSFAVEPPYTT